MKVSIRELEDGENRYTFDESPEELTLDDSGYAFVGPIRSEVTFHKLGPSLAAQGTSRYTIGVDCARCDEAIQLSFEVEYSFVFQKGKPRNVEGDEDETLIWLEEEGEEIDLGREVRDYILLEIPMNPVCAEYASGTCPNLEAVQDIEKSARGEDEPDPRWAALESLKEPPSEN